MKTKHLITCLASFYFLLLAVAGTVSNAADPWCVYEGGEGPGQGKHIVLVSGDEEYRSEEAFPQLGKILAQRHGFKCTVLFAIDAETGIINPDNTQNIPGLENLRTADLMLIATRFRDLPDEQMQYIAEYIDAGKPVIGMRAGVVAFRLTSRTYERFSSSSRTQPGGFGLNILGQTWMSHHGRHGSESTRGLILDEVRDDPIVRGCEDIWGPTDVYTVRDTLVDDSKVLAWGQVLAGMEPDSEPVEGPKNDPMMPLAWTRTYEGADGQTGRVFTTTMGAADDLACEDLRRMIVNASYWCVELEDEIPERTNVDLVGEYLALPFGFGKFRENVRPADHDLQ